MQMSVPSNLKMSVSAAVWRAVGGDVDGGTERERKQVETPSRCCGTLIWRAAGECCGAAAAGYVLAMIRDQQLRREPEPRSDRAPRRRDQQNARLFKVGAAETATG